MIMKLFYAIFFAISIFSSVGYCQKAFKDLQLAEDDFQDRHLSLDSTADAVIIFDRGETIVDNSGSKIMRHRRLKILTQEGLDKWGKVVEYYPRGGSSKIEAIVFHLENGRVNKIPLDLEFVFEGNVDKYTDKLACAFPNLKIGGIVEYQYSIKYWDAIIPYWNFQQTIPVLRSEYKVFYPISNGLTSVLQGTIPYTFQDKANDGRDYRWVMTNLPPFKPELFMPYEKQYVSSIKFWGYNESWALTCGRLVNREIFWGIVEKSFELKNIVKKLMEGTEDDLEKIKRIVQFVKEKVEWNKVSDYYGTWPKKLLEEKRGSSGDINLMLASLLSKAGFNVSMVLLSTNDNGFVLEEIPSATQFNYVLCMIKLNGKDIFLDATDRTLAHNLIPKRCTNTKGLRIDEKKYEWIKIPSPLLSKSLAQADIIIEGLNAIGKAKVSISNYLAADGRRNFPQKKGLGLDLDCTSENVNEVDLPLKMECQFDLEKIITKTDQIIYVTPIYAHKLTTNQFRAVYRKYPIDFELPIEETVLFSVLVPDGYTVEEVPPAKVISMANQYMKYSIGSSITNNKVYLTSSMRINQTMYSAQQNLEVREFFNSMIGLQGGQIVLRKK